MSEGVRLIEAERARQVSEEGYTPEHDKDHFDELVRAADAYLTHTEGLHVHGYDLTVEEVGWPWHETYWKPTGDPIRDLTKAGALIAAAIDSLVGERDA